MDQARGPALVCAEPARTGEQGVCTPSQLHAPKPLGSSVSSTKWEYLHPESSQGGRHIRVFPSLEPQLVNIRQRTSAEVPRSLCLHLRILLVLCRSTCFSPPPISEHLRGKTCHHVSLTQPQQQAELVEGRVEGRRGRERGKEKGREGKREEGGREGAKEEKKG